MTEFPSRTFARIQSRLWRRPTPELLTYSHGGGHPALKAALVDYLRVARSVQCDADQILITEGVHQAIDMSLRMLLGRATPCGWRSQGIGGFARCCR
ncbi:hypothetical protein [Thauera sp. SDU_THAU2]|uniref:hypothetical protein n=1 Tax=Thauera sp. SDU_THAU2 TaxID=3136633 RepID=UPI00311DDDB5